MGDLGGGIARALNGYVIWLWGFRRVTNTFWTIGFICQKSFVKFSSKGG